MKRAFKTYGLQTAEFFVLAVHVTVLGPILLAVALVRTGRPIKRYAYLFRRNVLASYCRARIDFRFGGFHSCARRLNLVLATLEDGLPARSWPVADQADPFENNSKVHSFPGVEAAQAFPVLSDEELTELAPVIAVYANLALCYFKMGAVESACQVVVRAHNKIGVQALPTLLDLDHRASQIVLASLAACRILENGGTATVVVKEAPDGMASQSPRAKSRHHSSKPSRAKTAQRPADESNVIPFPSL